MGQYHLTVNLDKKEYLMPHKFGVGLKLMEQFGTSYGTPDALLLLLSCSGKQDITDNANVMIGRWAGDRIAVVGDGANKEDLKLQWNAEGIYKMCHEYIKDCKDYDCTEDWNVHYLDISDLIIPVMMMNDERFSVDLNEVGWRFTARLL